MAMEYSTQQAAKILGVSTVYIHKLVERGHLKGRLITPRCMVVEGRSLERFANHRRPPGRPAKRK